MVRASVGIVLGMWLFLFHAAIVHAGAVYSARVPAPLLTAQAKPGADPVLAVDLMPDSKPIVEPKRIRLVFDRAAKKARKPVYVEYIPEPGTRVFPAKYVAVRCSKKDPWYTLDQGTGPICETDRRHVDLDLRWTVPYDMEPGVYMATLKVSSSAPFTLYIKTDQGRVEVKARGSSSQNSGPPRTIPDPVNLDGFFTPRGRLIGRIWLDRNGNGAFDEREGLGGVRVQIDHGIPAQVDPRGWFILDGLTPGRHMVWLLPTEAVDRGDGTTCRAVLAPTPVWIHDGTGTIEFFQAHCQSESDAELGFWRLYALGEAELQWVRQRMKPDHQPLKVTDTRLTLAIVGWLSRSEVVQLGLNLPDDTYVGVQPRNLPGNLYPVLRYVAPGEAISRYWVGVQMPAMQAQWLPISTGQLDADLPFRQSGSVMWAEYRGQKVGLRFVAVDPIDLQWQDRIRANGTTGPFPLTQVPARVEDIFVYLRQSLPGQPDAIIRQERLPPGTYVIDRAARRLFLQEPVPAFTPDGLENWIIVAYHQLQPGQSPDRSYGFRVRRQFGKTQWQLGVWSIAEFRRWGWTLQTRTPLGSRGEASLALGRVENLDFSDRHPWYGQLEASYRFSSLWSTYLDFSSYPNFVRTPGWEPDTDARLTVLRLRNDLQWNTRHRTRWGLEMTQSSALQWSPYLEHSYSWDPDHWLGVRVQSWWNAGYDGSRIALQGGWRRAFLQLAWQSWKENAWWDARIQVPLGASTFTFAYVQPVQGDGTRPQVRGAWRYATRRVQMGLQGSYQWQPDRLWILQGDFAYRDDHFMYHTNVNWIRTGGTSSLFTSVRSFWNPWAGLAAYLNGQVSRNAAGWNGYLDTSLVTYGTRDLPYYAMASLRWTRGLSSQVQPTRYSLELGWLPARTLAFGFRWSHLATGDRWLGGWAQFRLHPRLWMRTEYDFWNTPSGRALERTTLVVGYPLNRDTLLEVGYRWSRAAADQLERLNLTRNRWRSGPIVRVRTGIQWTLKAWLRPRQPEAVARFAIRVPPRAQRGSRVPVQIRALRKDGQPATRFFGQVWVYMNSEPAKLVRLELPFNRKGEWTVMLEIPAENTRGYLWIRVSSERPPYPQGWAGPIQVLDENGMPLTRELKPQRPQAWVPPEMRPPQRAPQPATFDVQVAVRTRNGQHWFALTLRVLDEQGNVLPAFQGKIRIVLVPEIPGRAPVEVDFKPDTTGTMRTTLGPIPDGTWVVMVQAVDKPRVVGLSTPVTVGTQPPPDSFSGSAPLS